MACQIELIGKRRDGGNRYWCLEHKADATAKYGKRAMKCRRADLPIPGPDEHLNLDASQFDGGIAIWGAVLPIYDTTQLPAEQGVHVHARCSPTSDKEIDSTYKTVNLRKSEKSDLEIKITELDAIYFMVSSVFKFSTKYITCTLCGYPHLDQDWFSIHSHQRHLCSGCGRQFRDAERSVGNPITGAQSAISDEPRKIELSGKSLDICQRDFPGGIQVWGSNPAIVWTAPRAEEEGIHIHAYMTDESDSIVIDDTFSAVTIDDISLDPTMVRSFMAQSSLPHISGRVINVRCNRCNSLHFDKDELAYTPHDDHLCLNCGLNFKQKGRLRNAIGNPVVGKLMELESSAVNKPRKHFTTLLMETISPQRS